MMLSGDHESAKKSLVECEKEIIRSCSILERALLYIALGKTCSLSSDSSDTIHFLNKARVCCRQAGAALFEKYVLQEMAIHYHKLGGIDVRDECAAEFASLDERHGGIFDWNLV
ncbi:hypothetical protein DICVIV_10770 [Dictyocaulus viviparus]|uniref:Uncharacterized protein n=1 Tax=Dictyocaulus viviparus TaxID=29172 RepID=A0A0D8XF06_DICVI|nr:hypothetical protein DICVIV_10770 [Dictyocaulus viviparus]